MNNKYILKLATIVDLDSDGEVRRVHSDPDLEQRARNAKLVKPPRGRMNKLMTRIAPIAAVGAAAYGAKQAYSKHQEKRALFGSMKPEHKKDLVNTATIAASGGVTSTLANKILHPDVKGGGMKAFAVGGGLGLIGDYAAVKLNNVLNRKMQGSTNH